MPPPHPLTHEPPMRQRSLITEARPGEEVSKGRCFFPTVTNVAEDLDHNTRQCR